MICFSPGLNLINFLKLFSACLFFPAHLRKDDLGFIGGGVAAADSCSYVYS